MRDGRVDADAQRGALPARRRLQPPQTFGRAIERALLSARDVVQLARPVDRDRDVLEESLQREIGKRLGPLIRDDRAVRREAAAVVALLLEQRQDRQDVLAHEDLAAGEVDLKAVLFRKRATQRVERELFAPLTFDVQEVADIAELAVQVAPHRRLVDHAARQSIGPARAVGEESGHLRFVAPFADAGPRVLRHGQRTDTGEQVFANSADQFHGSCQISITGPGRASAASSRASVLWRNGSTLTPRVDDPYGVTSCRRRASRPSASTRGAMTADSSL